MNTQVVFLAAAAVLFHVTAGRGFSVTLQNEDQLGDGTGTKQISREGDVSNQDLDTDHLILIKESVRNDLHDIRRRETRSKKRSRKRHGGSGDGSGVDQKLEKIDLQGIKDYLEPKKEMIINFMKPILDRIKHKPDKPSDDSSPAPSTSPPPSSTPSDYEESTPSDSTDSTPYGLQASTPSNPETSDLPDYPDNIYSSLPFSFSKCGGNENHRSMSTLSLLFPDLKTLQGENSFVFVPFTNTLMRIVEQQIIGESQFGGDPERKP